MIDVLRVIKYSAFSVTLNKLVYHFLFRGAFVTLALVASSISVVSVTNDYIKGIQDKNCFVFVALIFVNSIQALGLLQNTALCRPLIP